MPFSIDPSEYTIIGARTPALTMSLTRALIQGAAQDPSPLVSARLTKLHGKAKSLQSAWIETNLPSTAVNLRPLDVALGRAWGAVRSRLQDWVDLDEPQFGERSAMFLASLFPTGLDFVNFAAGDEWAESDRRIAWIEREQLLPELEDLVHARVMTRLHTAHQQYGDALAITATPVQSGAKRMVRDCLAALRSELANYARLVIGLVDLDDPSSIAGAEAQLAPILRFRHPRTASSRDQTEVSDPLDGEATEPVEAALPEPPQPG